MSKRKRTKKEICNFIYAIVGLAIVLVLTILSFAIVGVGWGILLSIKDGIKYAWTELTGLCFLLILYVCRCEWKFWGKRLLVKLIRRENKEGR